MQVEGVLTAEGVARYQVRRRRHGLTRDGVVYWVVSRILHGGMPLIGGPKIPEVEDDPEVGLPLSLREG
jgi:hypothetical protein